MGKERTLSSRDSAKAQINYLIPSITSLMYGLSNFLSNPRQKFYSFDAETSYFGFRIERRKVGNVLMTLDNKIVECMSSQELHRAFLNAIDVCSAFFFENYSVAPEESTMTKDILEAYYEDYGRFKNVKMP